MTAQTELLHHIWYYALPSQDLLKGKMLALELLGQPILLVRRATGAVFAIKNICPHRGVPLSYGRFDGAEIECPYHGWRFNATGTCTLIPSLLTPEAIDLSKFAITTYPIAEHQGNIWIYLHHQHRAPVPVMPPPTVPHFADDRPPQLIAKFQFPCAIDHAIIGLMDPAHVPFVHRAWWWRNHPHLTLEQKTFDPSAYGFTMRRHQLINQTLPYRLLGKHPEIEISFRLPGIRIETIQTPQHTLCNLTTITPIHTNQTIVTTMFYWTNPILNLLKPLFIPLVRRFMDQDRQMIIQQQEGLKYNPNLMLIKDADTQARWYYQIKKEYSQAIQEEREFVNPITTQTLSWRS